MKHQSDTASFTNFACSICCRHITVYKKIEQIHNKSNRWSFSLMVYSMIGVYHLRCEQRRSTVAGIVHLI